jgi:hypothetical protein
MTLVWIAAAAAGIAGLVIVVIASIARMRGRRSRFDRIAQLLFSAEARGVYPPSLRPVPAPDLEAHQTPIGDLPTPRTPQTPAASSNADAVRAQSRRRAIKRRFRPARSTR